MSTPARKENGESVAALRMLPRGVRRSGSLIAAVKRRLGHNGGLRLFALLLAIGLWFFVNAGQRGSVESFNVPVSYRNLPPDMVITNPHLPQSVKIEVSGPRTLLSLIDPGRLALKLDLTGVTPGPTTLRINPEVFNVPRQTTVVGVVPSAIMLDVDQTVTRSVPVHVMLAGTPAAGYRVAGTEVNPPTTAVVGPSREVTHIREVASVAIDISGATGNVARKIPLIAPPGSSGVGPGEVSANVIVSPIIVEKEFRGIPIHLTGVDLYFRFEPTRVNVTVRAPQLTLDHFDPNQIAAAVDGDGLTPGTYDVAVEVTLPAGIELVHQSVTKVKLRIYRAKRAQH